MITSYACVFVLVACACAQDLQQQLLRAQLLQQQPQLASLLQQQQQQQAANPINPIDTSNPQALLAALQQQQQPQSPQLQQQLLLAQLQAGINGNGAPLPNPAVAATPAPPTDPVEILRARLLQQLGGQGDQAPLNASSLFTRPSSPLSAQASLPGSGAQQQNLQQQLIQQLLQQQGLQQPGLDGQQQPDQQQQLQQQQADQQQQLLSQFSPAQQLFLAQQAAAGGGSQGPAGQQNPIAQFLLSQQQQQGNNQQQGPLGIQTRQAPDGAANNNNPALAALIQQLQGGASSSPSSSPLSLNNQQLTDAVQQASSIPTQPVEVSRARSPTNLDLWLDVKDNCNKDLCLAVCERNTAGRSFGPVDETSCTTNAFCFCRYKRVDGTSDSDASGPVDSSAELQRALLRQLSGNNGGASKDVLRSLQPSQPSTGGLVAPRIGFADVSDAISTP